MNSRYLAISVLAVATSLAASSGVAPERMRVHPRAIPGSAPLYVIGTRGAEQRQSEAGRKLDAVLADLARHAVLARPDHRMADLHALSPAAHFGQSTATGSALVLVDATTRSDAQQLKSAMIGLGLEHAAVYGNDVGGWLPVDQLESAAARGEVHSIRAAMHRRHVAAVTSQGDFAQGSAAARITYPTLDGTGVTVGVISDSFDCYSVYASTGVPASGNQGYAANGFTADYASDQSTGALPAGVSVLEDAPCSQYAYSDNEGHPLGLPFTDEGRAILQIVHDVAPGASLAFRTGVNSEADYAAGIAQLQQAGAKIIADDLGFYDEPFFQDGLIAQAIDAVEAKGAAYFSAAGNGQETPSYLNPTPLFNTLASGGANAGEMLLDFAPPGAATAIPDLKVNIPALSPGDFVAVVVEWDQPYVTGCTAAPRTLCTGASSQIDVCITGVGTDTLVLNYNNTVTSCSGPNAVGADPYQVMILANPADAAGNTQPQTVSIAVGVANDSAKPGQLILAVEDDGQGSSFENIAPSNGPTLQGHPGAAGAAAVGAAFYFATPRCGTTPAVLEQYSAAGGAPILFDTAGTRLATPIVRQKPDFVGPDGVNNTFLGYQPNTAPFGSSGLLNTTITDCQNNPSYPNFFGTSAATPHAAAVAALMLQANDALTPAEIYAGLQNSALPMSNPSPNLSSGYGFIQADAALTKIAPGMPSLSLAASSIFAGASTTISWSSPVAASCTASAGWSGTLAAAGNQTLTPTNPGTLTYTLQCANSLGTSPSASATLTVTNPPPPSSGGGGGGGGALGGVALLGLAGLTLARRLRANRG